MSPEDADRSDTAVYTAVVNHEEQYSIWADHQEIPRGWTAVGPRGSKEEVLAYIDTVWTDLRPQSLRKKMEEAVLVPAPPQPAAAPVGEVLAPREDDLVKRLSETEHPVEVMVRPEHSTVELQRRIEAGYVLLAFVHAGGRTELGVRLDSRRCDCSQADFALQTGTAHLEGTLVLNGVAVRCLADVELQTLCGRGHLQIVLSC